MTRTRSPASLEALGASAQLSATRSSGAGLTLVAAVLLTVHAGPIRGQTYRATVELVQLQVVTLDGAGGFVSGLRPEDFELAIGGVDRAIQVLYEVDLSAGDHSIPTPEATGSPPPLAARRHLLLFFDLMFTTRRGHREASDAALRFLEASVTAADLVGVVSLGRSGLEIAVPFSSDLRVVRRAVEELPLSSVTDLEDKITLDPEKDYEPYVFEVTAYLEQLRQLGLTLRAIAGRKHLVMFSKGFLDHVLVGLDLDRRAARSEARLQGLIADRYYPPDFETGSPEVRDGIESAARDLEESDTVVWAINPASIAEPGASFEALTYLADGTGGRAFLHQNDVSPVLEEIAATTERYYLLAYARRPDDPPTVDIAVRVIDPRVRSVRAPRRLGPPPPYAEMTAAQRQMQLAVALADGTGFAAIRVAHEARRLPLADGGGDGLVVLLEVPGSELQRLAAIGAKDEVRLGILGLALGPGGEILAEFRRGFTASVEGVRPDGEDVTLRHMEVLSLPGEATRYRILLRESDVGELTVINGSIDDAGTTEAASAVREPLLIQEVSDGARPQRSVFRLANPRLVLSARSEVTPGAQVAVAVPFLGDTAALQEIVRQRDVTVTLTPAGGSAREITLDARAIEIGEPEIVSCHALVVSVTIPTSVPVGPADLAIVARGWRTMTKLLVLPGSAP